MIPRKRARAQSIRGLIAQPVSIRSAEKPSAEAMVRVRTTPHLVRIAEAARITGLPPSLLRKPFMSDEKRPKNIPLPPPHRRVGRAVYILANELPAWIESLGNQGTLPEKRRRGRPTVGERIIRRKRELA